MHFLRAEDEIVEGQLEQRDDCVDAPTWRWPGGKAEVGGTLDRCRAGSSGHDAFG
jgi:hypothetical protein